MDDFNHPLLAEVFSMPEQVIEIALLDVSYINGYPTKVEVRHFSRRFGFKSGDLDSVPILG
jgi:hypothetical protein